MISLANFSHVCPASCPRCVSAGEIDGRHLSCVMTLLTGCRFLSFPFSLAGLPSSLYSSPTVRLVYCNISEQTHGARVNFRRVFARTAPSYESCCRQQSEIRAASPSVLDEECSWPRQWARTHSCTRKARADARRQARTHQQKQTRTRPRRPWQRGSWRAWPWCTAAWTRCSGRCTP